LISDAFSLDASDFDRGVSWGNSKPAPLHTFRFPVYSFLGRPATAARSRRSATREAHVKGEPKVLKVLNEVLKAELTAINQYFLHAEMCENWGYMKLAKNTRKESIEEMQHAEKLMERILLLDGAPNMTDYFKINIGQSVKQQFQNDLNLEYEAVKRLNAGVATCVQSGDNGSRELLEKILVDEEHHIDWLEAQLHAIDEMGIENYLAQHLHAEG
jgi:bacterioferritin